MAFIEQKPRGFVMAAILVNYAPIIGHVLPLSKLISNVVCKIHLQRISQDQAKAIMKRHDTPENVHLCLPKCEPTIWNEIPGKARSTDLKFQMTQAALLGAINCQLDTIIH